MAKYCRNCGAELNGNEKYCPNCGEKVNGSSIDGESTYTRTYHDNGTSGLFGTLLGIGILHSLFHHPHGFFMHGPFIHHGPGFGPHHGPGGFGPHH